MMAFGAVRRLALVCPTLSLALIPALAAAQAPAPVKIGLSAPLTGPDAAFGQGLRAGAEQAVAEINRTGAAGGRRLVLVVADDAGDGRQGAVVARKFLGEGVRLVVGPLESSVVAAVAPLYEAGGAVMVAPGASYPALTAQGLWNLFRLAPGDAQQGAAAGAWLAGRDGPVAIVHDRSTFGRGLADAVSRTLRARGRPEVLFESLPRGSREAGDLAGRLKAAQVRAVYFGGFGAEAAVLARAVREAGLDATLVASDGIRDRDFAAAGSAAEGTVMTVLLDRRAPEPRGKAPPRGPEASLVTGSAYLAVEVLAQGLARARSAEGRKVAEALRAGPVRTSLGEIAFDGRGDPGSDAVGLRVWRRTPDGRVDYAGNEP